ncbi:MAG: hypothetical protein H8E60_06950, partial [Candidatus Marinimicrobia bacterium]|nr:hypothetical protein [Candidatus Neomarinimicrobiota bacterium]
MKKIKRAKMNGETMYENFKNAYDKLSELLKNERNFEAFVLAFSILEDRVNATYFTLFKLHGFKEKSAYIPLWSKVKVLIATNIISVKNAMELKTIADERNNRIHSYFLNDVSFTEEDVKNIVFLIRAID